MVGHLIENWDIWGAGFFNTLSLTVLSFAVGFFIAIPVGLARSQTGTWMFKITYGYVYIIRGTPLLVQIFLLYYGVGQFYKELQQIGLWWFFREAYYCGLLALILNTIAYQAEIVRGALEAIPKSLEEAGASVSLSRLQIYRFIHIPIATARMLPALGNEFVLLLKASALVSVIAVTDIMGQARYLFSETLDLSVYYIAAANYLIIVLIAEAILRKLEKRNVWLTTH
ncbi:MAG: ABC transporter permease subunit [Desulfobacula sp.]|uniref:ABC transporter permease n=1 Tax=Desulfobacula sp. TaxID=2593537 RepID=UPI0025C606D6|nr:ABC transporter permease subunit [Desulfobacula sp.]MCD4720114.1 ABC transporter permease subunit [Desulfobacula sp.]